MIKFENRATNYLEGKKIINKMSYITRKMLLF